MAIVTDISINQDWNARKGANNPLTFTFTNAVGGAAFNISTYTFSLQIRRFSKTTNLFNLTQAAGLTNNGAAGTLAVTGLTAAALASTPADAYFWQMSVVHPDTNTYLWFQGTFNLRDETYTGPLTSSISGSIDVNGTTVNVAVTIPGGGGAAEFNTQTDSYTLVVADVDKVVEMNKATANNLTVPPNSSVAFPVGTSIIVQQYGAGQTTIVAGSGVTLRFPSTQGLKIAHQYGGCILVKRATNEWYVNGDLTA